MVLGRRGLQVAPSLDLARSSHPALKSVGALFDSFKRDPKKVCNFTTNQCEDSKCRTTFDDPGTQLLAGNSSSRAFGECVQPGHVFRNFANGQMAQRIGVHCCYSEQLGRRIWVEDWHEDASHCKDEAR